MPLNVSRLLSTPFGWDGVIYGNDETSLSAMKGGSYFTRFLVKPLTDTTTLVVGTNFSATSKTWGEYVNNYSDRNLATSLFFNLFRIKYSQEADSYFEGAPLKKYSEILSNCGEKETSPQLASDGLVAYYKFNGNANDETESYNGTIFGGATFGNGKYGQALNLDGSNDYVIANNSKNINLNDFTVSAWIYKNNSINNWARVIGKYFSNGS